MNLNPKTLRRVMVLIAGAGVIVAAGAGVYFVRLNQIAQKYQGYRDAGMAAFDGGDYAAALDHLKRYIVRHGDDRDALFAYATSRSRVEEPGGKHLAEGIKAFQRLRELEGADSPRVRDALLGLYTRAHYNTEAIELADAVLAGDPAHPAALRAKALALERLRRLDEAVAAAERLNEAAPLDLDGHLLTYRLYQRTSRPPGEVQQRFEALAAKHPQDPRFELLLAVAHGDAGDVKRARELLRTAATRAPPDAQFVERLAAVLDSNRMFEESRALLERAAENNSDPRVLAVIAQRLWQNGHAAEAAERLKHVDPSEESSDSRLLALRALALYDAQRGDEAKPIVEALAGRRSEGVALAWATALATRFADEPPAPREAIRRYQSALTRDPENGVIRYLLGEAYERLGESEPALAAWRSAAELAPSWSKPDERMARVLAATGRTAEAVARAFRAYQTAPHLVSPAVTYAVVEFQHLGGSDDPQKVEQLLHVVEQVQRAQPGEPETLPIRAALLARKGQRDAAADVIRAALAGPARPPLMTLLRLAEVNRAQGLGLEAQIEAAIAKGDEPLTPELALARASELAASGKPADGLALLEDATNRAGGDAGQVAQWRLAVARYREQTGDDKAAQAWVALGDAYADDAAVQTAILRYASSARGDRSFIARTIERVKQLTGDEGTLWQIERARWLLGSDREKDHSDAVSELGDLVRASPTLIEPRLLLAAALEKVDNTSGAIKELRVAAELEPRSASIATELARLLQSEGKFDDARGHLERVAGMDGLDAATRRQVAAMLAQQGAAARAIEVLGGGGGGAGVASGGGAASRPASLDAAGELLLAELYRRQGRSGDAEAIYRRLLGQPAVTAQVARSAADFFASQGKQADARAALKRLEENPAVPAAARELVLAGFAERHGKPEDAAAHYAAATKASPQDPAVWRERITYLMRARRSADALAVADEGLAALPENSTLQGLKVYAQTAANAAEGQVDLQPLIDDLTKDPANARSVATNQLLQDESAGRLTKAEAAARFAQLADRYPRHKPLQVEAVRRYLALEETRKAAELAERAMQAFPNEPEVAQLATAVHRRAGDWTRMEASATQWRARSLEKPQEADVAIAEARLRRGDPSGAVSQLSAHAAAATADPQRNVALLTTYARALAAAGRAADARALLEPLLTRGPQWRGAWVSVAGHELPDPAAASAWLRHVAPLIPDDAVDERVALAGAYYAAGTRLNWPDALQSARQILAPLAESSDARPEVFLLLASMAEAAGDGESAEAHYRAALRLHPDNPAALNNLAYLLLARDDAGAAAEALALANRAVALSPATASFHDTLARAQLKGGDRAAALRGFERALELDPASLEAMIGKATAHWQAGEREQVEALLRQIDAALVGKPPLPGTLRRELDALRSRRANHNASLDPR